MTVPKDAIADIKVVRTIKEDQIVYIRPEQGAASVSPAMFGVIPVAHSAHGIPGVPAVHGDGCLNHGLGILHAALSNSGKKAGVGR